MTAEERGWEMMKVPMNTLPLLALAFAKYNCNRYGGCGEVLLTSFIVYAQVIEGLSCTHDLYKADEKDKQWLNFNKDKNWDIII